MALNGLAGAGKTKTEILASKGIHEEPYTGGMEIISGLLGKKKKAGTRTEIPIKPVPTGAQQVKGKNVEQSDAAPVGQDRGVKAEDGSCDHHTPHRKQLTTIA
jgi:hypothetical protein